MQTTIANPTPQQSANGFVIFVSFLLALFLDGISFTKWIEYANPNWVTVVLFYWCVTNPKRSHILLAWCMGILLDITHYALFGQHALAKAIIALVVLNAYHRIRLYHPWQQTIAVFLITFIDITAMSIIYNLTQNIEIRLEYWYAAVTTALLWPVIYAVLNWYTRRRRYAE